MFADRSRVVIDNGYRPTPKQREFHAAPHRYKLYGGAMGGGKSRALCEELLTLCLEAPGNVVFLGRRDLADLKLTTLWTLLNETLTGGLVASHNKNEKEITLINGSKIIYGELKDVESLKSLNIGAFAIDEASEVSAEAFHMLDTRMRLSVPGVRHHALLASNPAPGWVKSYFVDGELANSIFVQALPSDNPYLPEGYVENLRRSLPEQWVRRYIEGDWTAFEGAVYPDFTREVHVIADDPPPASTVSYLSFDFGIASPSCILRLCVDAYGRIYATHEVYRRNMSIDDIAREMRAIGYDEAQRVYADPSIRNRTREVPSGVHVSVAQELAMRGIYVTPATNDILAGIAAVTSALRPSEGVCHPVTGEAPAPRLYVHSRCRNLIRELEGYRWADASFADAIDKPAPNQDDHAVDALRYFVASHPEAPARHGEERPPAGRIEEALRERLAIIESGIRGVDEHLGALY